MEKNNWSYSVPTEIYFGCGEISRLKELAGKNKKVLLVIGQSYLRRSGWLAEVKNILRGNKLEIIYGVAENPDVESVERVVGQARRGSFDFIIAIGGGSVLDCAKAAALLAKNQGEVVSFLEKTARIDQKGIPCIAIPTTAGSASEITPYSVITVKEKGIKITLAHKYLYPAIAIIDPDLLKDITADQAANSGIDVLCHAIESYWSRANNPISDQFALEAIRLIFKNLPRYYQDRKMIGPRVNMAKASLFAGLAFSNTRTTACHSISYPLTTIYGVPHGQACAITLPSFLLFNEKAAGERVRDIARAVGASTAGAAAGKIDCLMKKIGLKTKLRALGLKKPDLDVIIAKGCTPERLKNNPRKIGPEDLKRVLNDIY